MRRLNFVLLATVQLCGARHPGFSIHDDLVAYPQVRPEQCAGEAFRERRLIIVRNSTR